MKQPDTAEEICVYLQTAMPGAHVHVDDDSAQHARHTRGRLGVGANGGHYQVTIAWVGFAPLARLARARKVHEILQPLMAAGKIHALGLSLSVPA